MKYETLLEGLEISIIKNIDIDLGDRIDAEFFQKYNIIIEQTLNQLTHKKLDDVATLVASAFYPAATQLYSIGDTPFIRCVDCINYPLITKLQDETLEKIPISFVVENKSVNTLNKNDIVLTKVGTPCYASIIYEHNIVALSRTVMGLKDIHDVHPMYLLAFLRCKYGFQELYKSREQTIQFQLTLERVRNIPIFIPSELLQVKIEQVYMQAYTATMAAVQAYHEAESILYHNLNMDGWESNKSTITIKKFSNLESTKRLDAEYYQPKYDELLERLKPYHTKCLSEIVSITKSIEPGSEAYEEKGIPFIRVANLTKFGITNTDIYLSPEKYNDVIRPKENTILLSKDGSVGIAYKVDRDMNIITSGAILHLSLTDPEIMPDYLTLVLNSIIVKMQAERDAGGSIIQHWKPSEIEKVIIPILDIDIQKEITTKIRNSFTLRSESKYMQDIAKSAVEIAIDQGEDKAIEFLKSKCDRK